MNAQEREAHNRRVAENILRLKRLPIRGLCGCCGEGNIREWPTGMLECDNPRCCIGGLCISEFHSGRTSHMRIDVLRLTAEEIEALH